MSDKQLYLPDLIKLRKAILIHPQVLDVHIKSLWNPANGEFSPPNIYMIKVECWSETYQQHFRITEFFGATSQTYDLEAIVNKVMERAQLVEDAGPVKETS